MSTGAGVSIGVLIILLLLMITAGLMVGCPTYNVYVQTRAGEAELRRAEFNRQIAIREAEAEREAADLKRQTDIIRAQGIAESNNIIAGSITPEYLKWRFIEGLHDGSSEIIYVPTEAGLPILEANRLAQLERE